MRAEKWREMLNNNAMRLGLRLKPKATFDQPKSVSVRSSLWFTPNIISQRHSSSYACRVAWAISIVIRPVDLIESASLISLEKKATAQWIRENVATIAMVSPGMGSSQSSQCGKTNDRYSKQKSEQTDMRMLHKVRIRVKFEVDTIQIGKFTNSQVPHTIQDTAKVKKISREDRIQSERWRNGSKIISCQQWILPIHTCMRSVECGGAHEVLGARHPYDPVGPDLHSTLSLCIVRMQSECIEW